MLLRRAVRTAGTRRRGAAPAALVSAGAVAVLPGRAMGAAAPIRSGAAIFALLLLTGVLMLFRGAVRTAGPI